MPELDWGSIAMRASECRTKPESMNSTKDAATETEPNKYKHAKIGSKQDSHCMHDETQQIKAELHSLRQEVYETQQTLDRLRNIAREKQEK